ncbi:MAG: zonular occludens toxin domain-containing protein [Oscillospiraceae bacterium]|nr:zonular occludens toxin domain-containing protein [Oscillospiraceae bacterium]
MITAYTGVPGSGKTLDVMREICFALRTGRRVLSNIRIDKLPGGLEKYRGRLKYISNDEITPKNLRRYAFKNHNLTKKGTQYQTLIVVDECQLMFSDTFMTKKDAKPWLTFFSQHRKLRFNMLMVTQSMRTGLVRDIRDKVEIETSHWKMSNYPTKSIVAGLVFLIISLLPIEVFMSVSQWKAMPDKNRLIRRLYLYKPKYGRMYDTYEMYDIEDLREYQREESGEAEQPESGGRAPA